MATDAANGSPDGDKFAGIEFGKPTGGDSASDAGRGTGGIERIDPATLGGGITDPGDGTSPKRGRGRPKGSGGKSPAPQASNQLSVNGLESILLSTHMLLATVAKQPAFVIDATEAKALATAIKAVQDQYPVTKIDAKIAVLIQLGATVGMVYGPRIVAIKFARAANNAVTIPAAAPAPVPTTAQPAANGERFIERFDETTGLTIRIPLG